MVVVTVTAKWILVHHCLHNNFLYDNPIERWGTRTRTPRPNSACRFCIYSFLGDRSYIRHSKDEKWHLLLLACHLMDLCRLAKGWRDWFSNPNNSPVLLYFPHLSATLLVYANMNSTIPLHFSTFHSSTLFAHNFPNNVLNAAVYVLTFARITFPQQVVKTINASSKQAFTSYVIPDNPFFRRYVTKKYCHIVYRIPVYLMLITILICPSLLRFICIAIETLRVQTFSNVCNIVKVYSRTNGR